MKKTVKVIKMIKNCKLPLTGNFKLIHKFNELTNYYKTDIFDRAEALKSNLNDVDMVLKGKYITAYLKSDQIMLEEVKSEQGRDEFGRFLPKTSDTIESLTIRRDWHISRANSINEKILKLKKEQEKESISILKFISSFLKK